MAPAPSRKIRLNRAGWITQYRDNGEARMTNNDARKNDEIGMTKNVDTPLRYLGSWSLFRHSSFVIYKVVATLLTT